MAFFRRCLILVLITISLQSLAQDVKFSYQSKIGTSNIDTILVWARSFTTSPVSLGAVNLSWVYANSCLTYTPGNVPSPNSYWSLFRDTWTSLLDFDQLQTISVTYDGNTYDRRVQYGNAISFVPVPIVLPANTQAPILVMKLWFSGTCTSQVYMEDESENGLNQIADPNGNLLTYVIENLLSQPLEELWSTIQVEASSSESALLSWTPSREMGEGTFQIEKSRRHDFGTFDPVATLAFQKDKKEGYTFEDKLAYDGLSYYRIRYQAVTGQEVLSRVVSLYIEDKDIVAPIRIYPNPSNGDFQLNFLHTDDPVRIRIWDIHGRIVFEENHRFSGSYSLSLPALAAGQYQLTILEKDGKRWNKKLLIQ